MSEQLYPWGDKRRFNSYSGYFRNTLGGRVQKLSVNAGFTCPNRDGTISTGGCTFCNNEAFSPSYCVPEKSVRQQLEEGIEFHRNRYRSAGKYLAYFQSFTNTHAPLPKLRALFSQAMEVDDVVGIIVGTRPDCVNTEKLDYLAELARSHYVAIEYGIESCYNKTLEAINRGHDFERAQWAVAQTKARGIQVGAHFIIGLPGESGQMLVDQTEQINALGLNTVKFHQLQLFKDTVMATEFAQNPERFTFFELNEYMDLFIEILERLDPKMVIERFAGEAPPRYHLNPSPWGAIRNEQLLALLEKRLAERDTFQGRLFK